MFEKLYTKFKRVTSNQLYFPEIDGIRFVAILLVVFFHIHGYFRAKTEGFFNDTAADHDWTYNFFSKGDRGVELFFVLSGFILCLPFALQYIKGGKKIELKKYYLRRVTRLEPPYIIAITAIFLMQLGMHINPDNLSLFERIQHYLASLTYTHGLIYHHTPIITVVAWSLEIEIQFYVMAPIFFSILSLPRTQRRLLILAVIALFSIANAAYMPQVLELTIYKFIKYFFIGILLADFHVSNTAIDFFRKKWIAPAAALLLVVICVIPIIDQLYGKLLFPFLIGTFYYSILKNEDLKRVFSYKFIPIIGGMCYTIYLVHYTIITVFGRLTLKLKLTNYYLPNLYFQMAVLGALILVFSCVYYFYIERPFMDKKWMNKLLKKNQQD